MLHRALTAERFDKEQWRNDILTKAHYNNALWGFMIQISEQLHLQTPGEYGDDILFKLICMGVSNWGKKDHRTNASTQAMCHLTAMIDWVLQRIKQNKMTVSRRSCRFLIDQFRPVGKPMSWDVKH